MTVKLRYNDLPIILRLHHDDPRKETLIVGNSLDQETSSFASIIWSTMDPPQLKVRKYSRAVVSGKKRTKHKQEPTTLIYVCLLLKWVSIPWTMRDFYRFTVTGDMGVVSELFTQEEKLWARRHNYENSARSHFQISSIQLYILIKCNVGSSQFHFTEYFP